MDIAEINLNLLKVLNALLIEQHVTQAGKKINLSQSAVSNALKQLREIFDDELLVRGLVGQMMLTPKAKSLKVPVLNAIENITEVFLEKEPFEASNATMNFNVGMSDYTSSILLSRLIKVINKESPHITITITKLDELKDLCEYEHSTRKLDIALGYFRKVPDRLMAEFLFVDDIVCVTDTKHPGLSNNELDMKTFSKYPHLLLAVREKAATEVLIQNVMKRNGLKRTIAVTVPYMMIGMDMLHNTDLISMVPRKLAEKVASELRIAVVPPPFQIPKITITQYWNRMDSNKPAHQWLRRTIKQIAEDL